MSVTQTAERRAQSAERPNKPQTLAEAQDFIARHFHTIVGPKWVGIGASLGRILGKDIVAPVDLPRLYLGDGWVCRPYGGSG